ncbi:RHS repeat-associated core domain-containing protein [Pseudomonas sp. N3-W]|uniref:RHS repeat-associated core domain-containing protein n=1 Tax=Pseudomonas sp. N3-W TaxID=2975049 RepID=UPI00217E96A7|nr:RHS repeat-associated core domain-containing protein [Pseudomonas sp. N3-W]UWF48893.1 RHS repeat-associated core domain-containing protein [Pseudomonas sp. N3-W]
MQPNRETLLCHYHYDPLDRLVASTLAMQADTQRFYQKDRLTTEIQGAVQHSIMQHDDHLLAQQQQQTGAVQTRLLATDQQRSVLNALDATQPQPIAYTPYGHRPPENGLLSLLGFNGERPDPLTGHYLLGNGYRAFNPVLMRFNSPDSWSPFGEGGLNAYAYCQGDPLNFSDPTGHIRGLKSLLGILPSTKRASAPATAVIATPPGKMRNVTKLADNAFTFESTHKGGSRLTIAAHGSEAHPGKLVIGNEYWDAQTIIKNIDLNTYDRVRILACNSDEIGAEIALTKGKEVKAYIGRITTNLSDEKMARIYSFHNSTKIADLGVINLVIRKQIHMTR